MFQKLSLTSLFLILTLFWACAPNTVVPGIENTNPTSPETENPLVPGSEVGNPTSPKNDDDLEDIGYGGLSLQLQTSLNLSDGFVVQTQVQSDSFETIHHTVTLDGEELDAPVVAHIDQVPTADDISVVVDVLDGDAVVATGQVDGVQVYANQYTLVLIEQQDFGVVGNVDPAPVSITPDLGFTINLNENTHTVSEDLEGDVVTFVEDLKNNQVVLKINLEDYERVIFEVTYGDEPNSWTVNIGDSKSNNGWSGDSLHQSYDAEVQVKSAALAIFGNDYTNASATLDGHRKLESVSDFVSQGDVLSFEIANEEFSWDNNRDLFGSLSSPYLFALDGQSDDEGPINYDIYAAFNRSIGDASRNGSGASEVRVILVPFEQLELVKNE